MKLKNYPDIPLKVADLKIDVKPGETCEVADGYCHPTRSPSGSRIPSIIERLCPGLEPEDEAFREVWAKIPDENWTPPKVVPTANDLVNQGVAPGVAEIMAGKAAEESRTEEPEPEKPPEEEPATVSIAPSVRKRKKR